MKKARGYILVWFCLLLSGASAQTLPDSLAVLFKETPKGIFMKDSVKIGEPVAYSLSLHYPKQFQVVFPDSAYNFFPFELDRKVYFTTRTDSLTSRDSVVYYLSTFEIDKPLQLSLPVFIIHKGDSLPYFANADMIQLKEVIQGSVDSLNIKTDTELLPIKEQFNYPYWIAGIIGSGFAIWLFWFSLGAWIKKQFRLLRLKRKYLVFEDSFNRVISKIKNKKRIQDIETSLTIWKKYLEDVEDRPYSSYTSKEITKEIPAERPAESLLNIDKAIYGQIISEDLDKNLIYLKKLALIRYLNRKKEITGSK